MYINKNILKKKKKIVNSFVYFGITFEKEYVHINKNIFKKNCKYVLFILLSHKIILNMLYELIKYS
jgi:hypothetical protein